MNLSGWYSSLFVIRFSLIYFKKLVVGENRKDPRSNFQLLPTFSVSGWLIARTRRFVGQTYANLCNGKLWCSNINRFCNLTCSEILSKISSNLTWHSNMLRVKYLPKKHPRKREIAAREERTQETTEKTSIPSVKHGIVPIPGRLPLL